MSAGLRASQMQDTVMIFSRVVSVPLTGDGRNASVMPIANSGQLPSAAMTNDQLFVGYITRVNDKRSIWIVRTQPVA